MIIFRKPSCFIYDNNKHSLLVEVCNWETQLARIQNILEVWMLVQEHWLCLEPIFTTADIIVQMETEGKLFKVCYSFPSSSAIFFSLAR